MTYIPKPGERVRVVEVSPDDPFPYHSEGAIAIVGGATEIRHDDSTWCYLSESDDPAQPGTWCRVEPVGAPCNVCGKCPCYDHTRVTITGPAETPGAELDRDGVFGVPRVAVAATVRVRAYDVIATAVEEAVHGAIERVSDEDTNGIELSLRCTLAAACADAVKSALVDVLDFGDET